VKTDKSRLWHSRRPASPKEYGDLTEEEKTKTPLACHKLIRFGPSGEETVYLAAHAKMIFKIPPLLDFTIATG